MGTLALPLKLHSSEWIILIMEQLRLITITTIRQRSNLANMILVGLLSWHHFLALDCMISWAGHMSAEMKILLMTQLISMILKCIHQVGMSSVITPEYGVKISILPVIVETGLTSLLAPD